MLEFSLAGDDAAFSTAITIMLSLHYRKISKLSEAYFEW